MLFSSEKYVLKTVLFYFMSYITCAKIEEKQVEKSKDDIIILSPS